MKTSKFILTLLAILSIACLLTKCNSITKQAESTGEAIDSAYVDISDKLIPQFPFPPPKPSTQVALPKFVFKDCENLSDVNELLSEAILKCGYERRSYFSVPNGFALVTQLEQINPDGSPKIEDFRWSITNAPNFDEGFSLRKYFDILLTAKPGHYRCFVFLITNKIYSLSEAEPSIEEVKNFIDEGLYDLPEAIGKIKVNDTFNYLTLVYEFKKKEHADTAYLTSPSKQTCTTHLKRAKIWQQLKTQ